MYVAGKLAMHDELLNEAKKKTNATDFKANRKVLDRCRKVIERKFKLEHRPLLFPYPTVGQWVSDVCRNYQFDDLVNFFSQATGVPEERIRRDNIGSTLIDRPYLISLVERLESATGKSLLSSSPRPLEYLGNMPYVEIARYFAYGSDAVSERRRNAYLDERYFCGKFRKDALVVYRQMADIDEKISDEELMKRPIADFVPKGFGPSDWDLPVFWMEDMLKIQLPAGIKGETTVGQLLDMVMTEKVKELHKKLG